jgi:inosine-uridine nucleoside N-ribohydrolase
VHADCAPPAGGLELFVDCDPGLDDALALLVLAGFAEHGCVVLDGVCAVAGNGPLPVTARNAAYVLERAGLGSAVPVYGGEAVPVAPGAPVPDAPRTVHGPDALGGLYRPEHSAVAMGAGVNAIVRRAARRPPADLLALGPLTNVARALQRSPDGLAGLARMVVMGGAFDAGNTDDAGEPEFNWRTDPIAADRVCASGLMLDVVPLNLTGLVRFWPADVLDLAAAGRAFAAELLFARLELRGQPPASGSVSIHDAVAAVLAVRPDLATWQPVSVRVQRTGGRRGAAVLAPPGPLPGRTRLAAAIDVAATRDAILAGLISA